jgi:hypothetical protein
MEFDVFVTTDQNIEYQQNLTGKKIGIILLPSNQVPVVERLIPSIQAALQEVRRGMLVKIPLP